jgi:nitrite reductase/ring-hydroxylating ferredoxin subunit
VTDWQDVGSAVELERAGRLVARVKGREIGVLQDGPRLHAVRNRCPHHGGPLALGRVREREAGRRPGEYTTPRARVLRCPWHGWEFDLTSGRSISNPHRMRVRTYEVTIEVDKDETVEAYPVTSEDGLIVLHV